MRPVAVPLLPESGGALLEHMTPARIGGLVEHREDEIIPADGAEVLHHEIGAEHSGIEVALVFFEDVFLELLQQRGALGLGRHVGQERHDIVGLLVDAIVPGGFVEKRHMHGCPGCRKASIAALDLIFFPKDGGDVFKNLELLDAVAIIEQLGRGAARPVFGIQTALGRNPIADETPLHKKLGGLTLEL